MSTNTSSGGSGAILSTLKHAHTRTGLMRSAQALLRMNQKDGFDCPGCAWPEPKDRSKFEFCENGAKTLMNATTTAMIDDNFIKKHSLKELLGWSEYELCNSGRIVEPLLRKPHSTHFEIIGWDEAYDMAATHLKKLSSPDRAVFYTSGRASNEAAFLYQLWARMLGTNNLCDCSNLCHESSGVALKRTIGIGKGTVQLEDFENAEVIFLIGHNPSSNHPRMLTTLQTARKNGAHIVVINPLIEPGLKSFRHPQKVLDVVGRPTNIATDYFQVKVGGDYALFLAIAHEMLTNDVYRSNTLDRNFIDKYTHGFSEYEQFIKNLCCDDLVKDSGLAVEDIRHITKLIAQHDRVIYAWGMGITQTPYAVHTIETISNLALMKGHIGKNGAGLCPVRGHSNVQGNRTVGINEKPPATFLSRLGEVFSFSPPQHHGHDVVDTIHAMSKKQVDFFMALGGNFVAASPDTHVVEHAISRVDLAVNLGISLNRTHLVAGNTALILPCLTRVEKDLQQSGLQKVSVENSMGIVHASRGNFAPLKASIPSEVFIISSIAERSLPKNPKVDWKAYRHDYSRIRKSISDVLDDFFDFNERLLQKDGFLLTNNARLRIFDTPSKKAQFAVGPIPVARHDLLLTTIRSHDQFNTSIYGLNDRYRNVTNERMVVFINPADMKRLGVREGQKVTLETNFQGSLRSMSGFKAKAYDIKEGCVATYFPESNVLIPLESTALLSNTPTSKLVPVRILA